MTARPAPGLAARRAASLALVARLGAAVVLALGLAAPSAREATAEQLVTAISSDVVSISSNFNGSQIVFFGSIERDRQTVPRPASYEVVIAVAGPPINVVTREKRRSFGIWINRDAETFRNVPAFYALLSSRPMDEIAGEPARLRNRLGLDTIAAEGRPAIGRTHRPRFEQAFLRLMQAQGRYAEAPEAVEFMTPSLFRATLVLPPNVPLGTFEATVYLFRDGVQLAETTEKLTVAKIGFEQALSAFSRDHAMLYGFATVLMAIFTGWLAGVVFRRD